MDLCILTYAAVYLRAHLHRTPRIVEICQIVRTESSSSSNKGGWRTFRMRQQLTPVRSWASIIDDELWALHVTAPCVHQALEQSVHTE